MTSPNDRHRVYLSFQDRKGWHCQFLEADLKTPLPRHLHFKSPDKIIELVQRGGGFPDQESRLWGFLYLAPKSNRPGVAPEADLSSRKKDHMLQIRMRFNLVVQARLQWPSGSFGRFHRTRRWDDLIDRPGVDQLVVVQFCATNPIGEEKYILPKS